VSGGFGAGLTLFATVAFELGATFEAVRSVELQAPKTTSATSARIRIATELRIRMNYSNDRQRGLNLNRV
jgi:hypothetical protein